ncbi:ABC transporter substrate-binding protein [Paenibacillus mendelii]|uniref:ABC transporter substrate-binding protein n=1 Tax=Paenibacillus mendelii TaxID=206163 RepID=A0ABV6JL92_9BACL|nr:ABC transporter substrate-binding protein [Paenibacillus mendelii]MCQ6562289.1 ABC transporter substrate-binding protein [Paenibacillus mendelii]
MKKTFSLLFIILLAVSVAACSNSSNTDNRNEPAPSDGAAEGTPKSGGILKFAQSAEPTTLNPHLYSTLNDRNAFLSIYNSLMEYDPKTLKPVPGIVKEAKISEDGLVYDLTIQSGVTFHNGRKLTADDVKYSLEQANAKEATRTNVLLKSIKDIKVVDETHLTVTLSNKDSLLLDSFIEVFVIPNDPSVDLVKNPVGTGPFVFEKWNRNEKIVLKKNANYWKKGLPYLDGIEILTVPDAEVKNLQLINGQVDVIDIVPTSKVDQVANNPSLNLVKIEDDVTVANHFLLMNNSKPPFNNVKFRQAVNYALDREKIKLSLFGNFVVRSSPVPSGDANFNPDATKYEKDLDKAKQLLQESGYNNEKITLVYHKIDLMYDTVAQITEQSLKDLGLNVELKGVEIAQWVESVFNQKQYDMALTGSTPKPNTVDMLNHMYGKQNGGAIQWENKAWSEKLLTVSRMPEEEGAKVLKELQAEVLEETPAIIVGGLVQAQGLSKKVQDFIPSPQQKMYFESVWKK